MSMDDNGTESIGSNFGDNVLSGEDDRTSMSRRKDDQAEGDVENEGEEDYDRLEEDVVDEEEEDHEPRSENIDKAGHLPSHNHNLRPRKPRSYAHLFVQMGFKAGVKKFGARAEDAVRAEFNQLNDYDCLTPRSDLNPTEKRSALEYLLMIQEKRDGRIKARGCADGRK